MRDLISVIIPTYNRQNIILGAIKSVECQTYKNFEIVVVDDCSKDDTEIILKNNKDINYIKLDRNLGNAGARNVGVKNAKGDFIVFLDSDDRMKKDCLESFNNLIHRDPNVMFAFGDHEVYNVQESITTISSWEPNKNKSFLEELKIGTGCGIMVHKKCFEKVGYFDERLRVAVDTDWLIRLNKKVNYHYIPKVLVTIYLHKGERVRNDKSELIKSYGIIVKKNEKEINSNKDLQKRFFYKLQWLNYHGGNTKDGNYHFFNLIANRIFLFKTIILFLVFNIFPTKIARQIHINLNGDNKI